MKDDPGLVNYLLEIINNTLKDWTLFQKELIGESPDKSNGLISIKPPDGTGAWFSDDDMTILSFVLYEKFITNRYNELFKNFGSVILHWCGDGNHNLNTVAIIENLRAVHNFFLGKIDKAAELQKKLKQHNIALITGDIVPVKEQLKEYLMSINKS